MTLPYVGKRDQKTNLQHASARTRRSKSTKHRIQHWMLLIKRPPFVQQYFTHCVQEMELHTAELKSVLIIYRSAVLWVLFPIGNDLCKMAGIKPCGLLSRLMQVEMCERNVPWKTINNPSGMTSPQSLSACATECFRLHICRDLQILDLRNTIVNSCWVSQFQY